MAYTKALSLSVLLVLNVANVKADESFRLDHSTVDGTKYHLNFHLSGAEFSAPPVESNPTSLSLSADPAGSNSSFRHFSWKAKVKSTRLILTGTARLILEPISDPTGYSYLVGAALASRSDFFGVDPFGRVVNARGDLSRGMLEKQFRLEHAPRSGEIVRIRVASNLGWGKQSYGLLCDIEAATPTMAGDSSPSHEPAPAATPAEENPGEGPSVPPWLVIFGGAAALAAAAAALVRAANRRSGRSDREPPLTQYVLQVSSPTLSVSPRAPAQFQARVYRLVAGAPPVPVGLPIQICLPPNIPGLLVSPQVGVGEVECQVSTDGSCPLSQVELTVQATGPSGSVSASLSVTLGGPIDLELFAQKAGPLLVGDLEGVWVYARASSTLPDFDPARAAADIVFSLAGQGAPWLRRHEELVQDGTRCLRLTAVRPVTGATLPGPALVVACLSGIEKPLRRSLSLSLDDPIALGARVEGKKEGDVLFETQSKEWKFPPIEVYFHCGDDQPIAPSFTYSFDNPPFRAEPDVLELAEFGPLGRGQHMLRVRFRPGVDLKQFPELLCDRDIRLVVTAAGGPPLAPEAMQAEVALRLRPGLRWVFHSYDRDPRLSQGHPYQAFHLPELELVADSHDELRVAAWMVRTDRPETESGPDYAEVGTQVLKVMMVGALGRDFEASPLPEHTGEGVFAFRIRSLRGLLDTEVRRNAELALKLIGEASSEAPNHKQNQISGEQKLKPHLVNLRLAVVPGWEPGTSEAAVFARLSAFPQALLGNLTVGLEVLQPEQGASLQVRGALLLNTEDKDVNKRVTYVEGALPQETRISLLPAGCASWILEYQGLNWEDLGQACFGVRAGLPNRNGVVEEFVEVKIDVGYNLAYLLDHMYQNREHPELDLQNPAWDSQRFNWLRRLLGLVTFPDWACGPVENLMAQLYSGNEHYACGALSQRIFRRLYRLRFDAMNRERRPEDLARLNGIEINQFSMPFLAGFLPHVYAGIHLSGATPESDPRFIDPWWYQSWDRPEYRFGLFDKANERTLMARVWAGSALITAIVWALVAKFHPASAVGKMWKIVGSVYAGHAALGVWIGVDTRQNNVRQAFNEAGQPCSRYQELDRKSDWKVLEAQRLLRGERLDPDCSQQE